MKEICVISGKGGTGKTTLTAAFASLAKNAVLSDCDVDAADLHLILSPDIKETREFYGLKLAVRDADKCIDCGICRDKCRFEAIDEEFNIISENCEGCAVCELVCPEDAITMEDRLAGDAFISETRFGVMVHAALHPGEEASGKLVAMVRQMAKDVAKARGKDLILIDGPPGIGCPVIAAISGVSMVLVVTEPTVSGIHDLQRVLGVAEHFGIPAAVVVNKADINPDNTKEIRKYCSGMGVKVLGELPYDDVATKAMIEEKTLIEYGQNRLGDIVRDIWDQVEMMIGDG